MTAIPDAPAARPLPAADDAAPAISVEGLRKAYGGRPVVDGLGFDVRPGELFALLGPNGAGKTTTVEIIEGYRRPDAGTVRVLGLDPIRDGAEVRAKVGLMLQSGGVYPQARPREILRLFASFYRAPLDPDGLLRTVGLDEVAATRYRVLSGGQKQRLGLALALVGRPQLLVLDEPTAGMDPHAKASTRELIADLRAGGTTILLTTHEMADVERLADRIAVMDHGRLVALGTMRELAAGTAPRLRFRLPAILTAHEQDTLERLLGGTIAEDGGSGRYRLEGAEPSPKLVAALTGWCAGRGLLVEELRTTAGSLEERFLELTGRDPAPAGPGGGE